MLNREQQLAQCAEQLLAVLKDGSVDDMADYFEDIFTQALAGTLFEEPSP